MNQIHGTYTARSDDLTYEYDATWNERSAELLWSATILRERKALARPEGLIAGISVNRGDVEALVRNAVFEAIEALPRA